MANGFSKVVFTASSTAWTCPSGITEVLLIGFGGGGGGGGGTAGSGTTTQTGGGGSGGGGSIQLSVYVSVVPGTSYTVAIGAGGTGGSGANGNPGGDGTLGSFATFLWCFWRTNQGYFGNSYGGAPYTAGTAA